MISESNFSPPQYLGAKKEIIVEEEERCSNESRVVVITILQLLTSFRIAHFAIACNCSVTIDVKMVNSFIL